jgi:hypothetical protein
MLQQRHSKRTLSGAGVLFVPPQVTRNIALSAPQTRERIVFASKDGIKLIVETSTEESWLRPILREFARILSLQANWDSYGAREVDPGCIRFAIEELLPFAMRLNTPLPSVVPTNAGGVQLEWHVRGIDLEVAVIAPGRLHVFYENHQTRETWERTILSDLRPLDLPFDQLSRAD